MHDVVRLYYPSTFELKELSGGTPGQLVCKFSTFDIQDRMGDIVRRSALEDYNGAEVMLCWAHDWRQPIGKGAITLEKDHAVWDGTFWLDTIDGQEAYKKVKNAGALQEYSWGFSVKEANPIDENGNPVEDEDWWWGPVEITKAEPFEVSPVLIGANQETGTIMLQADGSTRISTERRRISKRFLGMQTNHSVAVPELPYIVKADDHTEVSVESVETDPLESVEQIVAGLSADDVDVERVKALIESLTVLTRAARVPVGNRFRFYDVTKRKITIGEYGNE